jgi:tetratricopeptide (TPR) repeat protein
MILLAGVFAIALVAATNQAVTGARQQVKEGKFEQAITALEKAHKEAPKDAEVRTALVDARLAYGDHFMHHGEMPPRVKYPAALKQYRAVLELDKDNAKAKENIATIESIYKSMGREVPK